MRVLCAGALLARILYDPDQSWALPNVVTLAGLHSAVPVPAGGADASGDAQAASFGALPVAYDARGRWPDAAGATAWAMASLHPLCNETDSLIVLQARSPPATLHACTLCRVDCSVLLVLQLCTLVSHNQAVVRRCGA